MFHQRYRVNSLLIGILSIIVVLHGCGSSDRTKRGAVEGKISFDKQAVESGMILFVPDVGVIGPPVQMIIQDGKYSSNASTGPAVGSNSIQITANRKTGKEGLVQGVRAEEVIQYIPQKYNDQTTLRVVVAPGNNQFDFQLEK